MAELISREEMNQLFPGRPETVPPPVSEEVVPTSGVSIDENKITLNINGVCMFENGVPVPFHKEGAISAMNKQHVNIHIKFNNGKFTATAWGSDLSEEYVTFNSMYTT